MLQNEGFFNTRMTPMRTRRLEESGGHSYKKGDKSLPKNYRPILLTCISWKVMEHIVLNSMSKYFSNNDIIIPHQHGFRKGFSTLTQLITVLDDWFSSLDRRTRTNVLLLDFAKASDSVPHQGQLHKLHYYCIRNKTPEWIKSFLLSRSQRVHVNGAKCHIWCSPRHGAWSLSVRHLFKWHCLQPEFQDKAVYWWCCNVSWYSELPGWSHLG